MAAALYLAFTTSSTKSDLRSNGVGAHVSRLAQPIGCLVFPLNIVFINVFIVFVHPLDKAECLGEERGVFVTVSSVLVGSLNSLVLVDYI